MSKGVSDAMQCEKEERQTMPKPGSDWSEDVSFSHKASKEVMRCTATYWNVASDTTSNTKR